MRDLAELYGKSVNVKGYANDCIKTSKKNVYVLVTNVSVSFGNITKKLDHVWANIKLIDSHAVNFKANVTIYQRKDGSCDYGFKNEVNLLTY